MTDNTQVPFINKTLREILGDVKQLVVITVTDKKLKLEINDDISMTVNGKSKDVLEIDGVVTLAEGKHVLSYNNGVIEQIKAVVEDTEAEVKQEEKLKKPARQSGISGSLRNPAFD